MNLGQDTDLKTRLNQSYPDTAGFWWTHEHRVSNIEAFRWIIP
jgi:hypothetical protein